MWIASQPWAFQRASDVTCLFPLILPKCDLVMHVYQFQNIITLLSKTSFLRKNLSDKVVWKLFSCLRISNVGEILFSLKRCLETTQRFVESLCIDSATCRHSCYFCYILSDNVFYLVWYFSIYCFGISSVKSNWKILQHHSHGHGKCFFTCFPSTQCIDTMKYNT